MDLDVFKTIRETVDWLVEKYKSISDATVKSQLNKIANHISVLATNKAAYLASLKRGLSSNEEYVDLAEIKSALHTAEADTQKLNELIKGLDSAKVTFGLKHGLERLANLKQIKVAELKEFVSKDTLVVADQEKIIYELEAFEQQWINLGKEIDLLFKEAKK